ncbi:MAG: DUF4132 domain-containing protein [Catenulispora sp.]|nr:DUF4132 domain-containing protein [Catenulispora sp.]
MAWWRRRRRQRAAERTEAGTGAGTAIDAGTGAGRVPEPGEGPASDGGRTGAAGLSDQTGRTGRSDVPGQAGDTGGADTSAGTGPNADPDADPDAIPWRNLDGGAYVRLLGPLAADPDVGRLLDRCARDDDTPYDRAFVDAVPRAAEALRRLVAKEHPAGEDAHRFVGGVLNALARLPPEEAVPLLTRAAEQKSGLTAGSLPLTRRAIRALAEVPGELVPPALHRLASESPRAEVRKAAYARLRQRLVTLSLAPEWTVERFRLDASSSTRIAVGPHHTAVVAVTSGGRVKVTYHNKYGKALAGKPTAPTVRPAAMAEVAELADALRTAVRAARTRLESAQRDDREIPTADWLTHYVDHPVTGRVARAVLWELRHGDGEWQTGLPRRIEKRWSLITLDRERLVPEDGDVLRVLHPRRLGTEDAAAWRRFLGQARIHPALPQLKLS